MTSKKLDSKEKRLWEKALKAELKAMKAEKTRKEAWAELAVVHKARATAK